MFTKRKELRTAMKEISEIGMRGMLYHVSSKMSKQNREKYQTLYYCELDKYYSRMDQDELAIALQTKYEEAMGSKLNYISPKTFTEKIQWMKIFDSTSQKERLADKYMVREWVGRKIGEEHLVPLIGAWDRFEDIDFSTLPQSFCLKTNHGSAMNLVVKDKWEFNEKTAKKLFYWWLMRPFWAWSLELHYRNIPRKIIAEKYIEEIGGGGLYDYKFHCFHGKPQFIQCIGDRNLTAHTGYQQNFDLDWNKLDWTFEDYPAFPYCIPRPECLEEMGKIAEILSSEFNYVRVDLYEISGKVYFGEMTFTPASGIYPYKGTWTEKKDYELGKMLLLPDKTVS